MFIFKDQELLIATTVEWKPHQLTPLPQVWGSHTKTVLVQKCLYKLSDMNMASVQSPLVCPDRLLTFRFPLWAPLYPIDGSQSSWTRENRSRCLQDKHLWGPGLEQSECRLDPWENSWGRSREHFTVQTAKSMTWPWGSWVLASLVRMFQHFSVTVCFFFKNLCNCKETSRSKAEGLEGEVQQLRTLVALPWDTSSTPELGNPSDLHEHQECMGYTHIHAGKTHTHVKNFKRPN